MGINTAIGWTDATINFWHGCHKVSPGCKYCYMFRDKERYGKDPTDVIKRKKRDILSDLSKIAPGSKIFTCSWSDFFIAEADAWRDEAWQIIKDHPQFEWQILTKRPERVGKCLPEDWGNGYENVWLGVSVEDQKRADERIPILLTIPAKIRFLSCEPLLGPLNLFSSLGGTQWMGGQRGCGAMHHGVGTPDCPRELHHHHDERCNKGIDWVIVGGESGNETGNYKYRPCSIPWISDILFQCEVSGVAAFVKQLGTHISKEWNFKARHADDVSEFPPGLQVQKFPN